MSIGSMNGMRLALAFSASISASNSSRRSSSASSSSASSRAMASGRGRLSATRRARARVTVRLIETFAARVQAPINDVHDQSFNRLSLVQGSAGLLHAHVPLNQPAHLPFRVAALDHPRDEVVVLLLGLSVLLAAEGDHRKQILDLREYPLFDH